MENRVEKNFDPPEAGQIYVSSFGRLLRLYVVCLYIPKKIVWTNRHAEKNFFIAECCDAGDVGDIRETHDYTSAEWARYGFVKVESKAINLPITPDGICKAGGGMNNGHIQHGL
ncbi:MAG: hypothetical protein V4443_05095 [Pseudomonadota bacterium]